MYNKICLQFHAISQIIGYNIDNHSIIQKSKSVESIPTTTFRSLISEQTPHWLSVKFSGHEVVQVKLFKTSPEAQAVQLLTVSPKQKVQRLSQGSQVPVSGLGNYPLGHTYLHMPEERYRPSMQLVQLLEVTPMQVLQVR